MPLTAHRGIHHRFPVLLPARQASCYRRAPVDENVRITIPVAKVLSVLLAEPDADRYGLDLIRITGLPSGTLYPVLHRLQHAGWVSADWETIDPTAEGRPARRYYRLTAEGVTAARQALAELRVLTRDTRPSSSGAGPSGAPAC